MNHYVKEGSNYIPTPIQEIMVTSEADLDELEDDVPIGAIAYTAGYKAVWQKGIDGNWVSLL